jgi:parvulin-like peptidyl-prolyl isomerase
LTAVIVIYSSFYCTVVFFSLDNSNIRQVADYLPLPVFATNRGYVNYYDYLDLKNFLSQAATGKGDLRQLVKRQLKIEVLLNNIAKKFAVTASTEELMPRYVNLASSLKSEEEKKQLLGSYYRLGEQRYIEEVVRYDFLKEKLEAYVMLDRNINAVAQARINKIMELSVSQDFDQLAKKYSDEYSAGEYFSLNDAESKFGKEVLEIQVGQMSQPIVSPKGYFLVKCYDRADNLLGLKYAFITAKSLEDYLEEEADITKGWLLYFI